jgi:hypothetical protein
MRLTAQSLLLSALVVSGCSMLNKPRLACDPVTGSPGCDSAGTWCEITSEDPQTTDCTSATAGYGGPGDSCSSTSGCSVGLMCVQNGAHAACRHVCHVGMASDCNDSSLVCVPPQGSIIEFGFCCPSSGC